MAGEKENQNSFVRLASVSVLEFGALVVAPPPPPKIAPFFG